MLLLALAGLANALYFTLAYYGRIRRARWVPEMFCAREGSNCLTVLQTKYARVFGVPNSLLGIVYYLMVIDWVASYPTRSGPTLHEGLAYFGASLGYGLFATVLTALAGVSVVLGLYLMYALRWKLKVRCPLCYTAHAINTLLLALLMLGGW